MSHCVRSRCCHSSRFISSMIPLSRVSHITCREGLNKGARFCVGEGGAAVTTVEWSAKWRLFDHPGTRRKGYSSGSPVSPFS